MGTSFCLLRRSIQAPRRGAGFSLVELIVVIVITGIIASVVGLFITSPIQGFLDQSRRAELVGAAQIALTRMGRDLRGALPNSVRVTGNSIELLLTLDGDRYRTESPGAGDDRLEFTAADTSFNTFRQLGEGQTLPAGLRLAIYPLGSGSGADPYANTVLTAAATSVTVGATTSTVAGSTEYRVGLSPGHRFPFPSPGSRVFLVRGPVSYVCDSGNLLRYENYAVGAAPGGTPAVIVGNLIQGCAFQYSPGTAQRNAVVSVALVLADAVKAPDERVRLIRQVHVGNSP